MTITREQVADLQPGDVVEVHDERWPEGTVVRGPLCIARGRVQFGDGDLDVGPVVVRRHDGEPGPLGRALTLTVVSRAPRPLYVNHPRTEPVPGDVVRDADDHDDLSTWHFLPRHWGVAAPWTAPTSKPGELIDVGREFLPDRLRLLVDGETGQVVP